jgi:hypothetical protein
MDGLLIGKQIFPYCIAKAVCVKCPIRVAGMGAPHFSDGN